MPFFLDKEEYEKGSALDGGDLARQRKKSGAAIGDDEIGRPYRHYKAGVPMLEGREYVRVANDDPKIDEIRSKTTRGQGWDKYEAAEKERAVRAAERAKMKEEKDKERAAAKAARDAERAEKKAAADAKKKEEKAKEKAAAANAKAETKAKEPAATSAQGQERKPITSK
jgi:hypothetical protein